MTGADLSSEAVGRKADEVQAALYRIAELASAARDMQEFYRAIHEVVGELMYARNLFIALYDEERQLISWPYFADEIEAEMPDPNQWEAFGEGNARGTTAYVLRTGEPQLLAYERLAELIEQGEVELLGATTEESSWLGVPLKAEGRTVGVLVVQSYTKDVQYTEQDKELLAFVGQHVGAALSRARAIEETRQRNAELALINSVQEALAGELELQAIYDAVGDRIRDVFDAQGVGIAIRDETTGLLHYPYIIERGERLQAEPQSPAGFSKHVLETREPLLITENIEAEAERYGITRRLAAGEMSKSVLFVPLVSGGKVTGVLSLQNADREHAFGESDQQLLTTLAGSLSVALDNARLVHETRQRNAELALINSVQEALAGELDLQAIYDAVGDRIRDVFDAQAVSIATLDQATGLVHYPYIIERGERLQADPGPPLGWSRHVLETREPVLLAENIEAEAERYGSSILAGEWPKSVLFVPLVTGGKATGAISLQNVDREHAFGESDLQLLTTLAGSLSVALENARLVHETRQRNAELALINSVQEAIAGEFDQQAIYDVVGDRIRDVFDAQAVSIFTLDEATGLVHIPYMIERGERLQVEPSSPIGFSKHVLDTREPLLLTENLEAESERFGSTVVAGEMPKSVLFVPLVAGGKATGAISLQNVDREHAFGEDDQRLLATLAGSLSVALDNARLVHETRQRNAELALINSVQEAIAGELDPQAIYDAVGDRIREVFDAQVVSIITLDEATGLLHYPYIMERDERLQAEPRLPAGFSQHVLETRKPLLITENVQAEAERYGSRVVAGEMAKSVLFVPLVAGGKATGAISLQNVDREHAFSESDQQLLETLAGSLSVALENARLVHETRQRNAELALINSVQEAIAGELDPQAIYEIVGDKVRDVFDAQVVSIRLFDEATGLLHFPYMIERGERLQTEPRSPSGFAKHVLETREPLLITENLKVEAERYGSTVVAGEMTKSALLVPLVTGGKATGAISLQNVDREHAFDEDDKRLLGTLAGSLSVALENARLVHETRQRVAELATVNSVGQALSSQLDLDPLIELVGERVRETFEADLAYLALHDRPSGRIDFPYYYEGGDRRDEPSIEYGEGMTSRILESREPLLLNRSPQFEEHESSLLGTRVRSFLGVPILAGNSAIGVISVQSIEEEGRFGEADVRLLATIAANVGVAIQNARLFTEIERQRGYLESLVSISPAAVVVLDADERVTDWNPAAAELFGYSAEEALGRAVDDLVFGDTGREEGREIIAEAMRDGRAQRITRRRRRDGTPVDVELMLVPLTVDGTHVGFLGVYHDVTELERARQEAEAATHAKSAFLATMSHEIRTPMNAVIGMTGLLLDTELSAEQREFAEVVRSSGDALLHVIDDILDYSKIEAGKLELESEAVDLRECVEGALDIVAPRAWEKEIELGCLIDEAAPAGIVGDAGRLRQVLLNLLSNAVKFTEEGEVVVHVDAESAGGSSYRLELAVRDTGIGIPPDRMDRLFESFSQIDASTTRRYGGTGLGLAITKRLAELMGGTMWVESEEGKGSTFHIELAVEAADVPPRATPDDLLPQLDGKRVLVVDDNATNREIVARHARSWGMEPVAIELPAEALACIEQGESFDVAVLDMMIPEMDGLALAGEIRRHRDERELPLVLLTSLGRVPGPQSSGPFAVQLAKPVKASQLYNALVRALAGQVREQDGAEPEPAREERLPATSSLRILLAEDNAVNRKVALRLLEQLGYRADVASNGFEALDALERQPYDVVLMDVQMPELDGLDASRRICQRWSAEERPRIIAMTANVMPEDREACFAAGMDDYVAKPIRPHELAEALSRARPLAGAGDLRTDGRERLDLDPGAVETLKELGGDGFVTEVVDTFLGEAPALMAALRSAQERGDAEELRRAAHTLKSNGQTFGAARFSELCRELEQRAKSGELAGAAELLDPIEREFRALEQALAALRPKAAS